MLWLNTIWKIGNILAVLAEVPFILLPSKTAHSDKSMVGAILSILAAVTVADPVRYHHPLHLPLLISPSPTPNNNIYHIR